MSTRTAKAEVSNTVRRVNKLANAAGVRLLENFKRLLTVKYATPMSNLLNKGLNTLQYCLLCRTAHCILLLQ